MDDEREEELATLSSIYPELIRDTQDPFSFTLDLPVAAKDPLEISFNPHPTLTPDTALPPSRCKVKHLPPLQLKASLPATYPATLAPQVHLTTSPKWLSDDKLIHLEKEAGNMWQEYGCSQILFAYIDTLQQAVDAMFDLTDGLSLPEDYKPEMIEYDRKQDKALFEMGSYDCGVCLDPKKGTVCHRMHSCGHVFCRSCLQDYYNAAITEGDVVNIVCLEPTCGEADNNRKKKKKRPLHPRELLEIGLAEAQVRRFVELKRKKKVEADKNTVYCPRSWCQAPARSAKYPPIPADLTLYMDSDDTDDDNETKRPAYTKDTPEKYLPAPADRLTVCSKCSLAFCRVCYCTWHGEFARCWPRNPAELTEEEKASYDYIRLHTSPCPTCSAPVQKTMGCNHMSCFQCNSHFCYLCSSWLDPNEPYRHFNNKASPCYQRLWELEEGDEGAVGRAENERRWEAEARAVAARMEEEEQIAAQQIAAALDQAPQQPPPAALAAAPVAPAPAAPAPRRAAAVPPRVQIAAAPPGPIDPMHRLALRREEERAQRQAQEALDDAAPANAAVGGAARARQRVRARRHRGGDSPERARAPRGAGRGRGGQRQPDQQVQAQEGNPDGMDEVLRRFIEMAARDEEDLWDSDELEDFDVQWPAA